MVDDIIWSNTPVMFILGFLLGQIVQALFLLFLIKFLLFARPKDRPRKRAVAATDDRTPLLAGDISHDIEAILQRTNYLPSHPAESCDWLTVLCALVIQRLRTSINFEPIIEQLLSQLPIPSITLTQYSLGTRYPNIKAASVRHVKEHMVSLTWL